MGFAKVSSGSGSRRGAFLDWHSRPMIQFSTAGKTNGIRVSFSPVLTQSHGFVPGSYVELLVDNDNQQIGVRVSVTPSPGAFRISPPRDKAQASACFIITRALRHCRWVARVIKKRLPVVFSDDMQLFIAKCVEPK